LNTGYGRSPEITNGSEKRIEGKWPLKGPYLRKRRHGRKREKMARVTYERHTWACRRRRIVGSAKGMERESSNTPEGSIIFIVTNVTTSKPTF
jgi:hypothetical protein